MLTHRHYPSECGIAFAAWRGFDSPLRHRATLSTCASMRGDRNVAPDGAGHVIWWTVEADSPSAARELLPAWIAERTEVREAEEVEIP
jgi:hypothetical protein